ncbi:MAG: Ca-activated chloride channel family protein [Verrucomicrobiales bacterium]
MSVSGKPRVLVLHQKPRAMRSFTRAMKEQEIEVDARGVRGLPETMEGLLAFDAITLADISATQLTMTQMELVKHYVMDFGGGVAMIRSENSFGIGGYYKTPVEEVLPLVSRFEKEKENPSLAMALIIDKSGSMQGLPIELARQAAKASVQLLSSRDQIGVIGFDSQPQIISELRRVSEMEAIHAAIDSLEADGGTDIYQGMLAGKDMLDNALSKMKHMIVLSDGQTSAADFPGLVQAMTENTITVSTVALGAEAEKDLLTEIAGIGRGRYYETMDPATVPQIFTKETMQASMSAIKEDLYATLVTADHPLLSGYSEDELPFSP